MKPLRSLILGGALTALLFSAHPASAAWNNVYQVTLFHKKKPAQSNYYAVPVVVPTAPATAVYSSPIVLAQSSPCCEPCQKTNCQTNYVQRSYYQPVTVMQTKTYYEPVTTVQTSYYYEPVTSYKYSCYYDACSCSYQQVAVPTTCYQVKAKSCPVQSWVQKSCQVPTTSYQKSYYWEPQTTCCTTQIGAPIYGAGPPAGPPPGGPTGPPPVSEQKIPGPPPENPSPQNKYYGPPMGGESSQIKSYQGNWQGTGPLLGAPVPAAKPSSPPPATPKAGVPFDKIAALPDYSANAVKGQVVSNNNAPKAHTQLVFVNASQQGTQKAVLANATGQFNVALTSGQWNVYIEDGSGQPKYHSKIQISNQQPSYLTFVSK